MLGKADRVGGVVPGAEPLREQSVVSGLDVRDRRRTRPGTAAASSITSSLFKACAKSAGGLPAALAILREAETAHRMTAEVRTCSLVTLLALCEAEGAMDVTMELVDMIREEDRTPEVLAALSSFFSCGIHG